MAPKKNKRYRVPADLLVEGREGDLLKYCLQHVYGKRGYQTQITGFLKIVRQTVYQWIKNGLPPERRETFATFVDSELTDFYLPSNAKLDDFIREREDRPGPRGPVECEALLVLLVDIVSYSGKEKKFGVETLSSLTTHMKNIASPHLFWKWAYHDGGIPVTYIEDWIRFALDLKVNEIMPSKEYRKTEIFKFHVREKLCVDPEYCAQFYGKKPRPVKKRTKTSDTKGKRILKGHPQWDGGDLVSEANE